MDRKLRMIGIFVIIGVVLVFLGHYIIPLIYYEGMLSNIVFWTGMIILIISLFSLYNNFKK
ncbi:MAG: hypothetical protein Q4B23_00960 [Helcococcus sp.]|nr:hypothetical protein [Helcococcus sp.]